METLHHVKALLSVRFTHEQHYLHFCFPNVCRHQTCHTHFISIVEVDPNFPYFSLEDAENKKIVAAQSILIIGGGPVGVELAGELVVDFPDKKVCI